MIGTHGAVGLRSVFVRWPGPPAGPPPAWRRVHAVLCDWADTCTIFADAGGPPGCTGVGEDSTLATTQGTISQNESEYAPPACLLALAPGAALRLVCDDRGRRLEDIACTSHFCSQPESAVQLRFRRLENMRQMGTCTIGHRLRDAAETTPEQRISVTQHGALVRCHSAGCRDEAVDGGNEGNAILPLEVRVVFGSAASYPDISLCWADDLASCEHPGLSLRPSASLENDCGGWLLVEVCATAFVLAETIGSEANEEDCYGDRSHDSADTPSRSKPVSIAGSLGKAEDTPGAAMRRAVDRDLVGWARTVRAMLGSCSCSTYEETSLSDLEEALQRCLAPAPPSLVLYYKPFGFGIFRVRDHVYHSTSASSAFAKSHTL